MIAIKIVSRAGQPLITPVEARFDDAGGDIGRSTECTLVLPDPERRISRKHLRVTGRGDRFSIRLISTNLACELNGIALAPGVEYPLDDLADIRIGPFVLRARDEGAATRPMAGEESMFLLAPAPPAAKLSVLHDVLHPAAAVDGSDAGRDGGANARAPQAAEPRGIALVPGTPMHADALVVALYVGLGLPPPPPALRTTEQMKLIGALLRSSLAGTLGLLASRTIAKRALGAGQTIPQMRENNPLKYSPDVDTALSRLLGPPQRGFLAPLAAVAAAQDDLRAHEVAMLAGMRAALEAILDRFNPAALESQSASKGVWDNLLPVNRKAKLWERFGEQYAEMLREVEDDFDALFGAAFLQAYAEQLAQLGQPGPPHDGMLSPIKKQDRF